MNIIGWVSYLPALVRLGEIKLLSEISTKYFWFIHNHALIFRREFLNTIIEIEDPTYMNFVFDGTNFRGFPF